MSATVDVVEVALERAVSYAAAPAEPVEDLPEALREVDKWLSDAEGYLVWMREEQIRLLVLLGDMDIATHFEEMDPDYAPRGRIISTAMAIDIKSATGSIREARKQLLAMRPPPTNVVAFPSGAS